MAEAKAKGKLYFGFYVAASMFLLMFPGCNIMGTAGIFYTTVSAELGVPISSYAVTLTIIQFCCAFGNVSIYGWLLNRFKTRTLIAASMLIEAICFVLKAMFPTLGMMYFTSVLISFPMSLLFNLCIPSLMNAWFPNDAGKAIGIVGCAQGLGGIIFKSIGGQIIANYGFKTCWLVWAAIAVIGIPIAWFGIRQNPEELGIEAIGKLGKKSTDAEPTVRLNGGLPAKQAYKTLVFWLLIFLVPSLTLVGTVGGYYEAFIQSKGFALAAAAAMGGLLDAGKMAFKIIQGAAFDRSPLTGIMSYVLTSAAGFLILILLKEPSAILIMLGAFLIGSTNASFNLLGPCMVREAFGDRDFAKLWPKVCMVGVCFGAIGSTLWGLIMEATSYETCFKIALALVVYSLVISIVILKVSKNYKEKWTYDEAK